MNDKILDAYKQYAKALEENPEPLTAEDKSKLLEEVILGKVLPDSLVNKLVEVANDNLERSRGDNAN